GLGAVFYELLVGQPPRHAVAMPEMLECVQSGEVDLAPLANPAIPQPLAAICRQALSPQPEDRQRSVELLGEQIERWQKSRSSRSSRLVIGIAAAAVGLLLAVGAALLANSSPDRSDAGASAIAANLVGHAPHRDFALSAEVLGHPAKDGIVALDAGDKVAVRLQSDLECYVGVWHIDAATKEITLLFPNDLEQDHFLAAGDSLTIPGRDSYAIEVSTGAGLEYLWIAASSQRWDAAAGREQGPGVVLEQSGAGGSSEQRAATVVARSGPRISEDVFRLDVKPLSESAR
ncbi:MAG TPA: DUF4384 domain-containing protein, partial [Pirellulaceae bacterium]|nr:DUF4384 domain-containing protein [Pirellulaceae bacterium]